ncbi:MAG TPA: transporter substrate-binding domain-containing protein [Candidatus Limnocylindrales bacterium]|nr:transporter substrate-binding domain-containing protein [Candidatus Limnocylindrales bacterium]
MRRLIGFVMVTALAIGACTGGSGSSGSPAASTGGGAAASFSADSTMGKIKAAGKLVCGTKFDVVGFGFKNPTNNEVEGLDADLCREIAKAIGVPPEFVEAISANRLPFLKEDKVDIVISTMTITDERKKEIDFSKVYYKAGQSILVKKSSTIQKVEDLAGKKVCSGEGSTSEKNVRAKAPTAELLLFKTYTEAGQALADGRCEAVSTDDTILFGLAQKIADTELRGGQFTEEPLGIGIKKGKDDFVAFINATLDAMKADGRLKALYDKHVKPFSGKDVEVPF